MGLAEAHYNRRGKALRLAHGICSAPCEVGTGDAVNCNYNSQRGAARSGTAPSAGLSLPERSAGVVSGQWSVASGQDPARGTVPSGKVSRGVSIPTN